MKVIFPVATDQGLQSRIFAHFGSAPLFLLVDAQARAITSIVNYDRMHEQGSCRLIMALGWQAVDAVVVADIGRGALAGLRQAGLRVYRATTGSVAANLALLKDQALPEVDPEPSCPSEPAVACGADELPEFGCGF